MFSRIQTHRKCNKGNAGGSAPPDLRQGIHPLHPSRRLSPLGRKSKFRLTRWGYGKFEGFWPKKALENPRGKARFSPRIIPWLSRMLRIRLASKGRRARSTTASIQASASFPTSPGTSFISPFKQLPRQEVQEVKPPGAGARGPHRPSLRRSSTLKNTIVIRKQSYRLAAYFGCSAAGIHNASTWLVLASGLRLRAAKRAGSILGRRSGVSRPLTSCITSVNWV